MAQTMTQREQQGGAATRRVGDFNRATRQSILRQPVQAWPGSAGQTTRLDLPQTGYFGDLVLLLQGTTTTAAASSTTAPVYPLPAPSNFIRRIRVYNNQGVELWNTSGYGCYLYDACLRTGFDQAVDHLDAAYPGGLNPFNRYYAAPTSLGASTSEVWKFAYYLPIAWGFSLQAGLQLLQDPAIRYTLELTWGDTTDLYSASAGTVTLSGVTVTPSITLYHVPAREEDLPRLSYTKTVLEDIQALTTGSGDNTYKFITGNMATRVIQEFSNAPGGVRAPIHPATPAAADLITLARLRYSQTQVPYEHDVASLFFKQRLMYGRDLPAGVLVHELSNPMGLPELPGTRDIINTARLTDLDIVTTLAGVTLTNGQLRTIREQLVANR